MDMADILVTGANRGIGLEFCRQLAARGDAVIAVCREASAELSSLGVRIIAGIDVGAAQDLRRLKQELGGHKIDILINNAGILFRDKLNALDFESIEKQIQINAIAPLRVTHSLLENLGKGSKVVTITSSMGSIADNTSGGYYGYRMSKAAVNMAMKSLSVDLADRRITVLLLHPGYVKTDMTDRQGNVTATESVQGLIARIDEAGPKDSGSFLHARGHPIPW
jgi:NAD(P)-dependent dehydrogenase (short-subunit alcohol dehydrogenase family)